jgi:hypothetical protein
MKGKTFGTSWRALREICLLLKEPLSRQDTRSEFFARHLGIAPSTIASLIMNSWQTSLHIYCHVKTCHSL